MREALLGNTEVAGRQARNVLAAAPGPDALVLAALAMAKTGDTTAARKLVDRLNTEFPSATLVRNYWLPTIRAEIELQGGNPKRALELLHGTDTYELAETSMPLIPAYVRGEAYLRAKQGQAAAAEFQKILRHRALVGNGAVGALAHLGLARAYALSGDIVKARRRYQDFFALWKDADPDIPTLREARAEYSKL